MGSSSSRASARAWRICRSCPVRSPVVPAQVTIAFVGHATPDRVDAASAYEDDVLPLLADHGAELLYRGRRAEHEDSALPLEVHLSGSRPQAYDAFLTDDRRHALLAEHGEVFTEQGGRRARHRTEAAAAEPQVETVRKIHSRIGTHCNVAVFPKVFMWSSTRLICAVSRSGSSATTEELGEVEHLLVRRHRLVDDAPHGWRAGR